MLLRLILACCSSLLLTGLYGQFLSNGTSTPITEQCYGFEPISGFPGASIWTLESFDLTTDTLDVNLQVVFGCPGDDGNEGFVFGFQGIGSSAGNYNGPMGFLGIRPSFGVEFDLRRDAAFGDPEFDHLAVIRDGDLDHSTANTLVAPGFIIDGMSSVQDCQPHDVRFRWLPRNTVMEVYVDCNLRLSYTFDAATEIFADNTNVFWGLAAANLDQVSTMEICLDYREELNQLEDLTVCAGSELTLNAPITGRTYLWTPADGLDDSTSPNPTLTPVDSIKYTVRIRDDCNREFIDDVRIDVSGMEAGFDLGPPQISECEGARVLLDAGLDGATYRWSDGSEGPTLTVTDPGSYKVTVTTAECVVIDEVEVDFQPAPRANLGPDTTICAGGRLLLRPETQEGTITWQDGSSGSSFLATLPGLYTVEVSNGCGSDFSSVLLSPVNCGNLFLPNVFSPDGDGINDIFRPFTNEAIEIHRLAIFDRWGALVYQSDNLPAEDVTAGWAGFRANRERAGAGTYIYVLEYSSEMGERITQSGEVTVIR